jgi:hypothetical protein
MKHLIAICFFLLLTACTDSPSNSPSLSITPPSSSLNAGDGPLSLIATLSNASGDVSWTLSPNLGTLSSNTGLQITYTPPNTLTSQTEVTLSASAGSLSAKATITVKPKGAGQTITVTGKVLNFVTSKAGAFLPILVNGQKTATDANGTFSVANVLTPYELVVVYPKEDYAEVYIGLTRPDPTVFDYYSRDDDPQESAVTYSFSNFDTSPAPPEPSYAVDYIACAASTSSQADMGRCMGDNINGQIGATPYSTVANWNGAPSIRANFYAWQITRNLTENGFITTDFRRFARAENVLLTSGQAASVSFNFQPLTTTSVSGTIGVPSGYTLSFRELSFKVGGQFLLSSESSDTGVPASFNWPAPEATGLELNLSVRANKDDAYVYSSFTIAPGTTGLTLALPTAPGLSQPATDATGVDHETVFSWTPFDESVYTFRAYPETEGALSLYVYTAQTQATLPDLSSLGYPLPKGVKYQWWLYADAPVLDTDEMTSGVNIYDKPEGYWGAGTEERTFTTAP